MEEQATFCIKVNLPGGVVSAGDMYEILLIAENAGVDAVSIGNRQQLYFNISADRLEDLESEMFKAEIRYEIDDDQFPNIISSYVTDNIFNTESWLKEGVYKDIFDLFDFQPKLKINLVDQHQTFVPFFSGNFNFIASDISNYWYLYIRFPKRNSLYCWPWLVYSDDIPVISKVAEDIIMRRKQLFYDQSEINHEAFYKLVTTGNKFVNHTITETLKLPDFYLPYYEGINKYANGKYWLGVYRRNEWFPIEFLKDICLLCLKSRIGQLYTTPWKSLLIKGINEPDRNEWGDILNKYRVNVRHASNELNWQLENLSDEGLDLKKQLVREFEEYDLRTYRLSFAIKMQPKTGLLGSVIIKKQEEGLFDILHTRDFNPNSKDFVIYKTEVSRNKLGGQLIKLCNYFYSLLIDNHVSPVKDIIEAEKEQFEDKLDLVYQCKNCLSIYDKAYGDTMNGVAINTDFETLTDYVCPVCESTKESFLPVAKKVILC
jgi:rubredoxin